MLKELCKRWSALWLAVMLIVIVALAACSSPGQSGPGQSAGTSNQPEPGATGEAEDIVAASGEDLVIPLSGISDTVTFYPAEVDGTRLEVLAVLAPDGTVRTAFNTCQVCFDSGRGYYQQSGATLVCQNCGNSFTMDQVETTSGGCNPVPILPENKTVDEENITIPYSFLQEAKGIFANWKSGT